MKGIGGFISKLPPWSLTLVTLILILWLTLSPKPLGDDPPELFPGADKIVHGLMFGFLLLMILVDRKRSKGWKAVGFVFVAVSAILVILLGVAIEEMQGMMELGRSYDVADIYADSAGTVAVAVGWTIWSHMIASKKSCTNNND